MEVAESPPILDEKNIYENGKHPNMEKEVKTQEADNKEKHLVQETISETIVTQEDVCQNVDIRSNSTNPVDQTMENTRTEDEKGRPKSARHVTYSEAVEQFERERQSHVSKILHDDDAEHLYRAVFRNEMHRLHRELETFKEQVAKEYGKNARRLEKKKKELEEELSDLEEQRRQARAQLGPEETNLKGAEQEEDRLQRKQALLDEELLLLDREEKLSCRQRQLEEYEAEIEKIEGYVERRMTIAKRRTTELIELDEEIRDLEKDLSPEIVLLTEDQAGNSNARPDPDPHTNCDNGQVDLSAQNPAAEEVISPYAVEAKLNMIEKMVDNHLPGLTYGQDLRSLQQKAAAEESRDEDSVDGSVPANPRQTALWDEERRRLLEKQVQTELALKKMKGDLVRSENSRQSLQNKVVDSEKQLRQAEKRIKELESKLSLSSSQGSASLARRATLSATNDGLSNGDAQSLSNSMTSQRALGAGEMKPIRFSVRVKATKREDTAASLRHPSTDSFHGDNEVFAEPEKPALAWQRYAGRRRSTLVGGSGRAVGGLTSSAVSTRPNVLASDQRSTVSEGNMGRSKTCSIQ